MNLVLLANFLSPGWDVCILFYYNKRLTALEKLCVTQT